MVVVTVGVATVEVTVLVSVGEVTVDVTVAGTVVVLEMVTVPPCSGLVPP
jgi:hypothetical protein